MANMRIAKKSSRPICSRGTMAFMMDFSTICRPDTHTCRQGYRLNTELLADTQDEPSYLIHKPLTTSITVSDRLTDRVIVWNFSGIICTIINNRMTGITNTHTYINVHTHTHIHTHIKKPIRIYMCKLIDTITLKSSPSAVWDVFLKCTPAQLFRRTWELLDVENTDTGREISSTNFFMPFHENRMQLMNLLPVSVNSDENNWCCFPPLLGPL